MLTIRMASNWSNPSSWMGLNQDQVLKHTSGSVAHDALCKPLIYL